MNPDSLHCSYIVSPSMVELLLQRHVIYPDPVDRKYNIAVVIVTIHPASGLSEEPPAR